MTICSSVSAPNARAVTNSVRTICIRIYILPTIIISNRRKYFKRDIGAVSGGDAPFLVNLRKSFLRNGDSRFLVLKFPKKPPDILTNGRKLCIGKK